MIRALIGVVRTTADAGEPLGRITSHEDYDDET